MEEAQIVLDLFVPSNEDTAKTVHPPVSALHHPTPSFEADLPFDLLRLLLPGSNMQRVAKFLSQRPYLVIVVAFIQAEMLGLFFRGLRSINGDAFQRRTPHLAHHGDWLLRPPGQSVAHDLRRAGFASLPVWRDRSGWVPSALGPRELLSSPRPWPATPTQSL